MAGVVEIAKVAGVKEADVRNVLNAIKEVAETESVMVRGFGTFKYVIAAQRNGRNPSTGEALVIPAKKKFKLKAA